MIRNTMGDLGICTWRLSVGDRPPASIGVAAVVAALSAGARWVRTSGIHGHPTDPVARGLEIARGVPADRLHLEVGLAHVDGVTVVVSGRQALQDRVGAALDVLGVSRVGRLLVQGGTSDDDVAERIGAVRELGVADVVGVCGVPVSAVAPAIRAGARVVCGRASWRRRRLIDVGVPAIAARAGGVPFVAVDPSRDDETDLDPVLIRAAASAGVGPMEVAIAWLRRLCDTVLMSPASPEEAAVWMAPEDVDEATLGQLAAG